MSKLCSKIPTHLSYMWSVFLWAIVFRILTHSNVYLNGLLKMLSIAEMISIKVYWYIDECRSLVEWYLRPGEKKVLSRKFVSLSLYTKSTSSDVLDTGRVETSGRKVQKLRRYLLVDWHLTERSYQRRMNRVISFRSNSKTVTALSPQISLHENLIHATPLAYASFIDIK
jgi:hypothetical protein